MCSLDLHYIKTGQCFNVVISHRVPLGFGSLLLKLGKLSTIFDGDQQLPYEQANQAQQ